jgi:hypothetical protein
MNDNQMHLRDRVRDRIEAWRFDPPVTTGRGTLLAVVAGLALGALGIAYAHRAGARAVRDEFDARAAVVQTKATAADNARAAAVAKDAASVRTITKWRTSTTKCGSPRIAAVLLNSK